VGDSVIVAANEPLSLTAKWDPQYEVTRVRGTTHWLRHQPTGKEIRVHMDKLRLVDPNMSWDGVSPRPRRQTHVRRPPPVLQPVAQAQLPPVELVVAPLPPAERAVPAHAAAARAARAPRGVPRNNPGVRTPTDQGGRTNKRRRMEAPQANTTPRVAPRPPSPAPQQPPPAMQTPATTTTPPPAMDTEPAPHFRPYNLRMRKRTHVTDDQPVTWQPDPEVHKRARIECIEFTHRFMTALTSRTRPPSHHLQLHAHPAHSEDGTSTHTRPNGFLPDRV
jgi:hypothetical protein